MTEEKKDDVQTVSVEQFNELKTKFDELTKSYGEQKEKSEKLEKIFNERQTKSLDHVLKELGFVKNPEKSDKEVITDKFKELEAQLTKLQGEIAEKDKRIALNDKKAKVTELAKKYNFIDVSDVLGAVDYENDDFEGQLKSLADSKKHWIAPKNAGGNFQQFQDDSEGNNDAFLEGFEGA